MDDTVRVGDAVQIDVTAVPLDLLLAEAPVLADSVARILRELDSGADVVAGYSQNVAHPTDPTP